MTCFLPPQKKHNKGDAEEEPTAGALELVDPEQEELVVEGGAEVEGDGDADDRDEEGNVEDDGDVSHETFNRRGVIDLLLVHRTFTHTSVVPKYI